jgi:hypothetical protein
MGFTFTIQQMKTVKCVMGIIETGKKNAPPSTLAVLKDKAGISFGRHQATEGSGNLWVLLFRYYCTREDALMRDDFLPYKEKLFRRGGEAKKGALTNDEDFKSLLVIAGNEDPAMLSAQNKMFNEVFFRPALDFAKTYNINQPLGLQIIYDMFIHSGPEYGAQLIRKYDSEIFEEPAEFVDLEKLDEEQAIQFQRAWISGLINYRNEWLRDPPIKDPNHRVVVQNSRYRTVSYQRLVQENSWMMELPLNFVSRKSAINPRWIDEQHWITEDDLSDVGDI